MHDDKPSKVITAYGATIPMRPTRNWLQRTALTGAQFVVEDQQDPTGLVIAFTGLAGGLSLRTFDFLGSTDLLKYNRVLVRDNSRSCYLRGIPPVADDFDSMVDLIKSHVERLAPKHTMILGSSGGSHAALLVGHLIGADYVHAFCPQTNLDPAYWRASEDPQDYERYGDLFAKFDAVPASARRFLDLRDVLSKWNGKTLFNLHVCEKSATDLRRAVRLQGLPGVTIHRHPCGHHRVAVWLAGQRRLLPLLKFENQPGFAPAAAGEPTAV